MMHLYCETIKSFMLVLTVFCVTCYVPHQEKLNWQDHSYFQNDQLLVFHGLSIADCVRECQLRPGCFSIIYNKYLHNCEINDISDQPLFLLSDSRVVLTKRQDWKEDLSTLCTPACNNHQRCNPRTRQCHVHECDPPPVVPNAVIKGNMRFIGSKVQYQCMTDTSITFTSVCLESGHWSNVPVCNDCGPPPPLLNGDRSFESTLQGSTVTYTCNDRYELLPGDANPSITCQESGIWTDITITCEVASLGISCTSDSDCLEANSTCVHNNDGSSSYKKCLCSRTTQYNTATRSCETRCDSLSDTYTKINNKAIRRYNIFDGGIQGSLDYCKNFCIAIEEYEEFGHQTCASFEYRETNGKCYLNYVSYLQILDGNPSAISNTNKYDLYSRDCTMG